MNTNWKLALYSEYIGDQRRPENRRLEGVANTEAEINAILAKVYLPNLRYRLEDYATGKTLDTLN